MKVFVKLVSVLLVFLTVLGLCACTKKEETAKNDWVNVVGIREGAISDTGYYYLNQGLLHYVDFQNGVNVCLCSKAGCAHDDSECEAEIILDLGGVFSTMFFWNGGIYFTTFGEYGWGLYRRNADGTGESKVASLCEKYMKEDPEIEVDAYFFTVAGNYVYYFAGIQAVVKEGNVSTSQTVLQALLRVDLRTGKEEIVVENRDYQQNKRLNPIAVRNDSAIYAVISYPDVEYGAENYDELRLQSPVQILQWSAETGESKVLLERTQKELGSSITYQGGKFYCRPVGGVYSLDLETGALTQVDDGLTIINADYGFLFDYEAKQSQLKNLKTGELLPNEFEECSLSMVCDSDHMVILTYMNAKQTGKVDKFYAFLDPESLSDGLQEEDVTAFYVKQ